MKLDNTFTVGVPIDQAWSVLTDLELIAPCMPGAQLTGVNDGVYTGKVKIKVGPVTAEYAGTARFSLKDDANYKAVIDARGRDSRGQGNATAVISAQLQADGSNTVVSVDTDLTIAGRIAQFGSGMIKEVSAKLLGQFVQCLEQRLGDGAVAASTVGGGPVTSEEGRGPVAVQAQTEAPAGAQAQPQADVVPAVRQEAAPLNLMSVAGGAVYKRVLPLVVVVAVVVALAIYFAVR